jgi:enoyl-CoA hydratase
VTYTDIRVETRGPATWITIDRPAAMNAVRPRTYQELTDAFLVADKDRATRFVVLTGEGPLERYRSRTGPSTPIVGTILDCTKPTIAAINGAAVGMGMDLALLCDMRIAAASAKLGSYFVRRGVIGSAGGTWLLPRMIGVSRAMELLLSGELIPAAEAERLGIVSRVVPDAELHQAVNELIDKLSMGAPLAQRAIKRTVHKGLAMAWPELEEYGRLLSDELWKTEDHREGVRSHVEKRKPEWRER